MNIKSITIDNVRGFEHWTLEQTILPNRPNILVAPNGFGKSSIATTFASLFGNKIEVKKENKPNEIETYHLLGIIYNHPLHIAGDTDISQPLGMKFDNPAIKTMIKHLWEDETDGKI